MKKLIALLMLLCMLPVCACAEALTITYVANNGRGQVATQQAETGVYFNTLGADLFDAPTGQKFYCWLLQTSGSIEQIEPGSPMKTDHTEMTLTADWVDVNVEMLSVTVDLNGGTLVKPAPGPSPRGKDAVLPPYDIIQAPEGMEFLGWEVDGKVYPGGGTYKNLQNPLTIKALWVAKGTEIALIGFHANGGTGSMNELGIEKGKTITLPQCEYTAPEGKRFKCWNVAGKEYAPGDALKINDGYTVMAVWENLPQYAITFDGNGATAGEMTSATVQEGGTYMLPWCNYERVGHNFAGWQINGEGKLLQPYENITVTADTKLVASWNPYIYNIHFSSGIGEDNNNSSGVSIEKPHGVSFKLGTASDFGFTCKGHEFIGWKDETNGPNENAKLYVAGEEFVPTAFTILVAQWKPLEFKVTFLPGESGTGKMEDGVATYGYPYSIPECSFKPLEGYEFRTWLMNGQETPVGTTLLAEADTTVTALWQIKTYTVTYKTGDGMGYVRPIEDVEHGQKIKLAEPPEVDERWAFVGWKVNEQMYRPGQEITVTDDITAVAQWKIREVSLTYVNDNGDTLVSITELGYGEEHTVLTLDALNAKLADDKKLSAPAGYEFNGWLLLNTEKYIIGEAVPGDMLPLYSHWLIKPNWVKKSVSYTLTLDMNGGDPLKGSTAYEGGYFELPTIEVINHPDGLEFAYFEVNGKQYGAHDYFPATGNATAKAIWKTPQGAVLYTVSFDANGAKGSMAPVQVEEGTEYTLPAPDVLDAGEGMNFDGWLIGNQKYGPGTKITVTGDIEVVAQWKTRTVSLTYQTAEGAEVKKVQGDYGMEHIVLTPEAAGLTVPTNQKFAGWKVYNSRGGELNDVTAVTGQPITLYSEWLIKPVWVDLDKLAVSFAPGEGGGKQDTAYVYEGHEYVLPGCTFTAPLGKAFDAWGVGDKSYQPGETIKVNAATTVVALWKPATVTLTFKSNNSSQAEEKVSMSYGTVYTLPECMFTADGNQVFDRWRINGAGFDAGSTYTVTGDFDVLADWANPEYTMTLYANNGTDDKVTEVVKFRDTFTLPANSFEAPYGKQFSHWLLETPAGNEPCDVGAVFSKVKANLTFKAIWVERDKLTVRFAAGEGSGKQNEASVYVGYEYELPVCTFTAPVGKTFEAWSVGGAVYQPGETFVVNEPTTVLALWKTATVTLTFKANNSSRGEFEHEVLYGTQYPMPECTFVPDKDKVFESWRIENDYYDEGETYTVYGDMTITAMWADEWYTFSYVDSYDNTKKGEKTIKYKTSLTLGSPDDFGMKPREYHKFAHWEVDGVAYAPGKEIPYDSLDKEITAMWEFDQSRVDTKVEETPVEMSSEMTQEEVSQAIVEAFGEEEVEKLLDALPPEITKPAQIVDVIEDAIPPEYETETMTLQNVELMFKPEGSDEWVKATAENFPTTGIAHTLDLNEGTSPDTHDYAIAHMIMDGEEKGEVELIDIENVDENGVTGRFYSLSPVSVVAKPKQVEGTIVGDAMENLPKTGDASCLMGWIALLGASGLGLRAVKRRKK